MSQTSNIKYADVLEARRYDAEYFKPEYLEIEKKISTHNFDYLNNITHKIDVGFVGSMTKEYCDQGTLLLQTKNIEEFSLNLSQTTFINEQFHKKLKKSQVRSGDILIARSGSFGKASIYMENEICNSSDIIIVEGNNDLINNFYLVAFLNSKFGVGQLTRFASGGLQGHVNLTILESLKIPIPSESFQLIIEKIIKLAHQKQVESKKLHHEAQQLLLTELGLLDYEVKHSLWFSTTKKEVNEAFRYDSEYFQPKYAEIIEKIEKYDGGWDLAKNTINFKDKNYTPKDNRKYKYLALSNISSQGYIQDHQEEFGKDLPSRARRKINTNDLIISSIEGSLSSCALIEKEFDNSICSTGFFVINSEKINPETLLVLFKSLVIQQLLKRGSKGTILTAISKTELENIKVPLIKLEVQKQIEDKIQESHRLRKESKELLKEVKRKVEEEIEKK